MIENNVFANLKDTIDSAVTRRKFLQLGGIGAGTILGGSMLSRLQSIAAPSVKSDEGILVVVYLMGGNDPLTMLAPYSDNTYRTARPNLSLSPDATNPMRKCLPIGKVDGIDYGFHPNLPTIKSMFDAGQVAVVPGLGFSGYTMSHFMAQEVYWNGWAGTSQGLKSGWAGRYLDTFSDAAVESTRSITMNGNMPLPITGVKSKPISLPKLLTDAYATGSDQNKLAVNMKTGSYGTYSNSLMNQISSTMKETTAIPNIYGGSYPTTPANEAIPVTRLSVAAGVINENLGARVIHTQFNGYDTHVNADVDHPARLAELDGALKAFFNGLNPEWKDRVTVLVYSEMGRRVAENGNGTDHGRAAMALLLGNKVNGGIRNAFPSLKNLDSNGNLQESIDFREVYGDIVDTWLGGDEHLILGKTYNRLGLFKSGPGNSTTPNTQAPNTQAPNTQPPQTTPPTQTQPPQTTPPTQTQPPQTTPPTQTVTTKAPPQTSVTTKVHTTQTPVTQPPGTTVTTKAPTVTTKAPPVTVPVTQPPVTSPPVTVPVTVPNPGNNGGWTGQGSKRKQRLWKLFRGLFGS